jgi:hypothetical protein
LYRSLDDLPLVSSGIRAGIAQRTIESTWDMPAIPDRFQRRSGWWAETLWGHCLQQAFGDQVCLRQQIILNGVTRGEADAMVQVERGGAWQAWELTVKRYRWLGSGDSTDPATWLGPNGREHPNIKWLHLREKQLPLTMAAPVQDCLASLGIAPLTPAKAWPCGRLFFPWHFIKNFEHLPELPDFFAPLSNDPAYLTWGLWLDARNANELSPLRRGNRFVPLGKSTIMAPRWLPGDTIVTLLTWQEIQQTVLPPQGIEIAELQPGADGWSEVRRLWLIRE